ncbi:MAG: Eco57I restriction-modification methylase domain-containing protein [Ktedonobacteraceae bacterium]
MSEQNGGISTDSKDLVTIVQERLKALGSQKSLDPLKDLFWQDLEYTRVSKPLSYHYGWSSAIQKTLYTTDPILHLATGGTDNEFDVLYIHLKSPVLLLGEERPIVMELLKSHLDALFIFSNASQDRWHFVNVKQDAQDAKRRLLRRITVGPEERLYTASHQLAKLQLASRGEASRLDIRQWHEAAFNVEEVTKRFFEEYKALFKILQIDLKNQTSDNDSVWAHDYALQFLNRCMFLYFIQRKGWLGGDKEFLHSFWQSYQQSNQEPDTFFTSWLQVLFFEAFNNQFDNRHSHFPQAINAILANAPYLNGGLFARNNLDTQQQSFTRITDERFEQVFTFFEKHNFTISEDSPLDQEVAVDPEMIGRVYESLVNVSTEIDERSDAGIFYTPRTEIDLMCRLSVVDYLNNHLGESDERVKPALYDLVFALEPHEKSEAEDAFKEFNLWKSLHSLLENITVLDPACGSGSFLVGMLHVLDDLHDRVNQYCDVDENPYRRKMRIIRESLYGVDAMGWAVHIAELRLWLALIVDADTSPDSGMASEAERHVRRVPLLPHLSFKIRQGDSLVQELGGLNMGRKQLITGLTRPFAGRLNLLKEDKRKYFHGPGKSREAIEQDEFRLFCEILDDRIQTKREEIKKRQKVIEELKGEHSLFENKPTSSASNKVKIAEKEKLIAAVEQELEVLQQARAKLVTPKDVPFVWDLAFAEVLDEPKNGFDIVIGNPPYVRQEQIADPNLPRNVALTPENKRAYKNKLARSVYQAFPEFFGYIEGNITARHKIDAKSDLYIYFYLHGLSLLNEKGSFCFITSNSWLDVGYGADLQEFLLTNCRVKMILDNQYKRSFATADVNTVIALFSAPTKQPGEAELANVMRFVMFKVTFEHILAADVFRKIEQIEVRLHTPEYRVYPITQKSLLADGYSYEQDNSKALPQKGTSVTTIKEASIIYSANKWGGKYLRAPEIYWTIIEKGRDKLVRLGDIAEIRRGITTGANEFFYLDEAKAKQWHIEEEFLRPVIKSPKECRSILIDPHLLKSRLFLCHKSKEELKGTAALAYIKWGESKNFHKNPSCSGRAKWWSVQEATANSIFVKEANDTSAVFYNPDRYLIDCRLYYADLPVETFLYLNSCIGAMLFEIYNRAGLGEGARSMMVSDYLLTPSLNSDSLNRSKESLEKTLQSLYDLPPRKLLSKGGKEWTNVDSIVFDALNLTQEERDAVYEAVIGLVESRLKKASSFKVAQEQQKRVEAVENTLGIWIGLPREISEDEVENHYA